MEYRLFGRTKKDVLEICLANELPGINKWPANHPIWDCNIANKLSPRQAWKSKEHLMKAIDNLFYITQKSMMSGKYPDFVNDVRAAFSSEDVKPLLKVVQFRFTVAKIAPKVTALRAHTLLQVVESSKIDISYGAYCPMAGFGGIIEGVQRWFKNRGLDYSDKIEAYDINPHLCKWYGWETRDALAQIIHTDKVVIACPPFGKNTERWLDTPEDMYYDFHDWCKLLKEHIIAPNYIFIGPETIKHKKTAPNLFKKKLGVQYYPEYSTS